MDANQGKDNYLQRIIDRKQDGLDTKFLNFKWIFTKVKKGDAPSEEFDMLRKKRRRNGSGRHDPNKRPRNNAVDQEVITLSDNEDDIMIVDGDEIMVVEDSAQTPVQPPADVTLDITQDEDDDDIRVLEERIRKNREETGGRRYYIETSKATSKAAPMTVDILDDDEEEDDITEVIKDDESVIGEEEEPGLSDTEVESQADDLCPSSPSLLDLEAPALETFDDDEVSVLAQQEFQEPSLDDLPKENEVEAPGAMFIEEVEPSLELPNDQVVHGATEKDLKSPVDVRAKELVTELEESAEKALEETDESIRKAIEALAEHNDPGPSVDVPEPAPTVDSSKVSTSKAPMSRSSMFTQQIKEKTKEANERSLSSKLADLKNQSQTDEAKTSPDISSKTSPIIPSPSKTSTTVQSPSHAEPSRIVDIPPSSKSEEPMEVCNDNVEALEVDKAPPTIARDLPTVAKDIPSVVKESPIAIKEPPKIVKDTPSIAGDSTSVIKDTPSVVKETSIIVKEKPITILTSQDKVENIAKEDLQEPARPSKPSSLLNRIIATISKRLSITDEAMAVGVVTTRSIKFDKWGERRAKIHYVKTIDQHLVEDFNNMNIDTEILVEETRKGKKKTVTKGVQGYKVEAFNAANALTKIKRLKMSSSSQVQPSSFILHKLHTNLLLEGSLYQVRAEAYNYLDTFLFLHLNQPSRGKWLSLVLGSFRSGRNEQTYNQFDITNNNDIHSCWIFFNNFVKKITSREEVLEEDSGVGMFLEILTKLLTRDFDSWWKHYRCKDEGKELFPLLYYLLGGSMANIHTNIKASIVQLYKWSLTHYGASSSCVRRLLAMSSMILSYCDATQGNSNMSLGMKKELYSSLSKVLVEAKLEPRELQSQLTLLQPNWLACHVSLYLEAQLTHSSKDVTSVGELMKRASDQSLTQEAVVAMETYMYKLISSQNAHTIFRANWFWVRALESGSSDQEFRVYKMMNKLEKEGHSNTKVVKFEEVTVRQKSIIETVNEIREYANKKPSEPNNDSVRVSAFNSLLFPMQTSEKF